MSARREVTKAMAKRYASASKLEKQVILDELCKLTLWHRDNARKALRLALRVPRLKPARKPRVPVYDESVMEILRKVWAVLNAPSGKLMAPVLARTVTRLRACGELNIDDDGRASLVSLGCHAGSAPGWGSGQVDAPRSLAHQTRQACSKARSRFAPGPSGMGTSPGFVEIDLVGHEGGNPSGDFCQTLTVTDICTGWTKTQAVKNKAQKWVFAALQQIVTAMPFAVLGIDWR